MAEEHKTAVRNIRRDENDRLKKALKEKSVSEDERKMVGGSAETDRSVHREDSGAGTAQGTGDHEGIERGAPTPDSTLLLESLSPADLPQRVVPLHEL
jgi:hypothetical protein